MKKKDIHQAVEAVNKAISSATDQNSMYSRGLSSEGYLGGYRDALSDVLTVMNKMKPRRTGYRFWEHIEDES